MTNMSTAHSPLAITAIARCARTAFIVLAAGFGVLACSGSGSEGTTTVPGTVMPSSVPSAPSVDEPPAITVPPRSIRLAEQYSFDFLGGVRFKAGTAGSSRVAWNPGPMAVSNDGGSLWIAGHTHHFSLARFELPSPVYSTEVEDYPIAEVADAFVRIDPPDVEGKAPDRITGMAQIGHSLVVNVAEYYDADADNLQTTVVFDDAWNLISSQRGYFRMQGAVHAGGWISPVPKVLQDVLGGPYLAGFASNLPINGRSSMGPSLFVWHPATVLDPSKPAAQIATRRLIDYSLRHPLSGDLRNNGGDNTLWTELSSAAYGFFTPGNSHYLVVGSSGGHKSGVGYKITQENGYRCGGWCANDYRDVGSYFWMYSLEDLLDVHCARREPHDMRPTDFGELPVFTLERGVAGADYDPATGRLYLLMSGADNTQSRYENQPVLLIYQLSRLSAHGNIVPGGSGLLGQLPSAQTACG